MLDDMDPDLSNGNSAQVGEPAIRLDLTVAAGQALKSWLLHSQSDGRSALDVEELKPTLVQPGSRLDFVEGVAVVRRELEEAGFQTDQMSDEKVAELGRRIGEAPLRRAALQG